MRVVVVIPTYNEVDNITRLIPILAEEFKKMPRHDFKVLVVDDNSPDGTAEAVKKMTSEYPFLSLLLQESKKGLGVAYVNAFKKAMNEMGAEVLVEMDADFQHDPEAVIRFIAEIDKGYDYVIGSRFTRGGSIPENWAFYRKLLSIGGNLFSRLVLGIFNVNDFTSGFKASRVHGFVDHLDLDRVLSGGFAYKIDLLFQMHKLGAKIKEVPIVFGLRDRGDSKMERNNLIDSLKVVLTIRVKESQSFIKFMVVGFAGLFTDLGIFNLLRLVILSQYASAASGLVAMTVTFAFNNLWSFGDRKITKPAIIIKSFAVYGVFSYIPIIFRSWLVKQAVSWFGNSWSVANASFFVGVVVGLVWNFTVYSRIIWKKEDSAG